MNTRKVQILFVLGLALLMVAGTLATLGALGDGRRPFKPDRMVLTLVR